MEPLLELIEFIEYTFDINLTIGEKISLKYLLNHSKKICSDETSLRFGGTILSEALIMYLNQYGISYGVYDSFKKNGKSDVIEEYFRRVRYECILL